MRYTIETGKNTESTSYLLSDDTEFNYLLDKLKDNNNNNITPFDIRNLMLSLYSNSVFNLTSNNNKKYIGIDSNNPNNRDIKNKILLGKRLFNNDNVYTNDMNDNDSDIFIFNTKKDFISNDRTDVFFLAGIDRNLYDDAPRITTQYVSNKDSLTFNIVNKNSSINLNSVTNISLNNKLITSESNLNNLTTDNKVLMYENNEITLSNPSSVVLDGIDTTEEINFTGNLYVNNYSLEFSDNRMVPKKIGSIQQGESFNKVSISQLLKRIIYSELDPLVSIKLLSPYQDGFIEAGTSPTDVLVEYKITKTTNNTNTATLTNMLPDFYPPITDSGFKTIIGTASCIIPSSPEMGSLNYTISVTDIQNKQDTDSVSLNVIYPIFYGIGSIDTRTYQSSFLNKLVTGKNDITLRISGVGKIYFIYPIIYGELSEILNENRDIIEFNNILFDNYPSPEGNWVGDYFIYESKSFYEILDKPMYLTFKF